MFYVIGVISSCFVLLACSPWRFGVAAALAGDMADEGFNPFEISLNVHADSMYRSSIRLSWSRGERGL